MVRESSGQQLREQPECVAPVDAGAIRPQGTRKTWEIIACALAHRANRIAFALVRDQAAYDPARWAQQAT
jgi:hypothetical protein